MIKINKDEDNYKLLTGNLELDLNNLKNVFFYPKNKDFVIRPLHITALNVDGIIIYLTGSACINTIVADVIQPLTKEGIKETPNPITEDIINKILTTKEAHKISNIAEITTSIAKGNTLLLIENSKEAISISTTEFEHRSIEKATNENTIKGPKEAFVESANVNRSLIRKHIKYANLVTESIEVGEKSKNDVYMMYIEGIADPELIENIRSRVNNIKSDSISNVSMLEQFIEERSYSLIPTILYTERPDRASAFLNEGHIVLLIDGSPACLIAPVTFWAFFHTAEDQYERWVYGNFIRIIRLFAVLISLLVPGLYIAMSNFHAEMIPSDLAVSIAAAREVLPFPIIVEVILMEIAFELIREAGVRIPTTIGPTIGIVGALILGQAAVEANIISPILVIIVSITGLSSFALPDISLSYAIRISRFLFLLAGAFMGFLGISLLLTVSLTYMINITSFGVPFMSPYAPHYPSSHDSLTRAPLWKQVLRPSNISNIDFIRRKPKRME